MILGMPDYVEKYILKASENFLKIENDFYI